PSRTADYHAQSRQRPTNTYHERRSSHVMLGYGIHAGGIDLYQYSTYFVRSRFLRFLDLENVCRSETFADDRFHESLLKWLWFGSHCWLLNHISREPLLSC